MNEAKKAQLENQSKLTAEELRRDFLYEPETGHFYSKIRVDNLDGSHGYRKVSFSLSGKRTYFKAHRLAYLYMTGEWPVESVDHINGDKQDNKWSNLRHATHAENLRNMPLSKKNTSGYKNVSRLNRKWAAHIGHNNKKIYLGSYNTPEEAFEAFSKKAHEIHGEFAKLK